MEKGSKFGRQQQEEVWQNAEVDALYRLAAAGVRVPQPYGCFNGVLIMDLVSDDEGNVAPRLNDVSMSEEQALEDHAEIMDSIKLMLIEGIIHGDLSEFNVLVDDYGPVIIDLPQAVDAAGNNNAFAMLDRDVRNMSQYYGQYAPQLLQTKYAKEMWALYEDGELLVDTELTGEFEDDTESADVDSVMMSIKAALEEEEERLARVSEDDSDDEL
jgi:RIO kinase 1